MWPHQLFSCVSLFHLPFPLFLRVVSGVMRRQKKKCHADLGLLPLHPPPFITRVPPPHTHNPPLRCTGVRGPWRGAEKSTEIPFAALLLESQTFWRMVSSLLTSLSGGWHLKAHGSSRRRDDTKIHVEDIVYDYINGLPSTFENNASPPLVTDEDRMRLQFSRLDRDGLIKYAIDATKSYSDALDELLQQELAFSGTLAELRYVESQLNDKDEDMEVLRLELQAADNYAEMLLREKADALRKLNEAKKELTHISSKAASLQRDLDAKTKREKIVDSQTSTPRTTAADTRCCSLNNSKVATPDPRPERSVRDMDSSNNLRKELLRRSIKLQEVPPGSAQYNNIPTKVTDNLASPMASDVQDRSLRDLSFRGLDPCRAWCIESTKVPLGGSQSSAYKSKENDTERSNDTKEWRRLLFESQKQNELLRAELAKAQASSVAIDVMPSKVPLTPKGDMNVRSSREELELLLRRSTAELERVERELHAERERNRKQGRLKIQLLKDVKHLAQRLHAKEKAERLLWNQRRVDRELSKEQLLEELCHCRALVSEMSARLADTTPVAVDAAAGTSKGRVKSEAAMTEELAAALEDALVANETLRTEKECVFSEKRIREASYEAELRSRVAEMKDLTAALHELREQVDMLREQRSFTCSTKQQSQSYGNPISSEGNLEVSVDDGSPAALKAAPLLPIKRRMSNTAPKCSMESNFDAALKALGSSKNHKVSLEQAGRSRH